MSISLKTFSGIAPRISPRLLPEAKAQRAENCRLYNGELRALRDTRAIATMSVPGVTKTIYRFGQDVTTETQYWFQWAEEVNVVRGAVANDSKERTYYSVPGQYPRMTDNSIATAGGGTQYPALGYRLGVPKPAPTVFASALLANGTTGVDQARVYAYVFVTASGQPGPLSAATASLTVKPGGAVVRLTGMETAAPATWGPNEIATKRIYRSVSGTSRSVWQLVADIALAAASYDDSKSDEQLGAVLPSANWYPPPDPSASESTEHLRGLTMAANGIMAGFAGSDLYLCEPYLPHAWPRDYVLTTDYPIMALGAIGTAFVVLTSSYPYLASGSHPSAMSFQRMEINQACVSRRSVAQVRGAVMYASPDGIVRIGMDGASIATQGIMRRDEWQAYAPESILAVAWKDCYIGFYQQGATKAGFIYDPASDDFITLSLWASAAWVDPKRDALYLVINDNSLVRFDDGVGLLTYIWKSRRNQLSKPVNYGAGQVLAATYPVTCRVYADLTLVHTEAVANEKPFRLPSGFKAREWEVELEGTVDLNGVFLAATMKDLESV